MYRLERMEENRWWRWHIRLIAVTLVVGAVYHGLKWLYQLVF